MSDRSIPIIVKLEFGFKADLWKAISDHQTLIQWFFEDIPEFKAEVGFKTKFPVHSEDRTFTHVWEILEVVEGEKLVLNWRYEEYPGAGKVTFLIENKGEHQVFTVINEGLDSFPADIPEFQRESCEGGWNYFIKERLKNFIV